MVHHGDMVSFALGFGRNEALGRDEGGSRQPRRTMVHVPMQGKVS